MYCKPHMIIRCCQIQNLSCHTIAETTAVAIFPPLQPFLADFVGFVPILCAVKPIKANRNHILHLHSNDDDPTNRWKDISKIPPF